MNDTATREAVVIEVIRTVTLAGRGIAGDPAREITTYWSLTGKLLAVADPLDRVPS